MSLRDEIIQAQRTNLVPVEVPEWGKTVYLKRLGFGDRIKWAEDADNPDEAKKLGYVVAVLHCVCDQDGNKLFTADDYDLVAGMNYDAVLRVGYEAAKLNKMIGDPVDDAKKD